MTTINYQPSGSVDSVNLYEPVTIAPGVPTQTDTPRLPSRDTLRSSREACVMIVDDEFINIEIVQAYLEEEGFTKFVTTTESETAVDLVQAHKPDVVLLDIKMPKVSGLQILKTMRSDDELRQIPAVILTASNDSETKLQALRLGASDFLAKPIDPSELLLRIENVISAKALQDHLADYSERLEKQVRLRTEELLHSRQEAIHCLARAGEYRDDDTGHHVTRVGRFSALIAHGLGFPQSVIDLLEQAAQLHDLGKIGVPDAILHKPGKLDPEEFVVIQKHCDIGCRIIDPHGHEFPKRPRPRTSGNADSSGSTTSPVLKMAAVIAATHHEKWDGSGYPNGLAGDEIPIEGRIVAVADVFDAISSKRPYKEAFPIDKCIQIMTDGRGNHFDPRVLDVFFECLDDIVAVRTAYNESEQDSRQDSDSTETSSKETTL
jgi:putative two-component system response regulator